MGNEEEWVDSSFHVLVPLEICKGSWKLLFRVSREGR